MSIQFRCDQCSHTLAIGSHKAGSTIHCPVCLGLNTVPSGKTDVPDADVVWWNDEVSPTSTQPVPEGAPANWWLTNAAPLPAPVAPTPSETVPAFRAAFRPTEPTSSQKFSEPPVARKSAEVTNPSSRLPILATLGGGFVLLTLAGTVAFLAIPKEGVPRDKGNDISGLLVENDSPRAIERIAFEPKPVESVPPERTEPPVPTLPPKEPIEKKARPSPVEKESPPPPPPAEKETPPPAEKETPPLPSPVVKPPKLEPVTPKAAEKIVVKRRTEHSEDDLVKQIKNVPALFLDRTVARAESMAAIQAANFNHKMGRTHTDSTLVLLDKRADLAGLPLRRGEACRLTPTAANHLDSGSLALRTVLATTLSDPSRLSTSLMADKAQFDKWQKPEAVPALMQMLMAEKESVREVLVDQLSRIEGKPATVALARLAVFDLNPRVREQAILALEKRPVKDYRGILLQGFDHPWPAIADHAAEAVAALKLPEAVPVLLAQLDKPDPQAPYEKPGTTSKFVKELVRVNHFSNCLLCHPPSTSKEDKVRGLVPETTKAIPTGVAYYASPVGQFVRADITYLVQDFSTTLPVDNPGLWPSQQRFDFVVRERFARPADLEGSVLRKAAGPTPQQQATFFALRELTGQDPGPSVEDWKKLALDRKFDVRLRYRGMRDARALAVDDKGRAYIAIDSQIVLQQGDARPRVWLTAEDDSKWVSLSLDRRGHLLAGRFDPAEVVRVDRDTRAITALASRFGEKPLNGPRRMVTDRSGGIYFGEEPNAEARTGGGVFYLSSAGTVSKTASGPGQVRGLDLSPNGKTLYAGLGTGPEVWAFPVESVGSLGKGRVLARLASYNGRTGAAAGLVVDARGFLYVLNASSQEIEVFGPEGGSLAKTRLDEPPVACALGGEKRQTLYVLTATSLYTVALSGDAKVTATR